MRKIILYSMCGLLFILSSSMNNTTYYTITAKVVGIRNNKGTMQLQVYRSSETFKKETPYKIKTFDKKDVKNNTLTCVITGIPPGEYGIALLDDENSDSDMNYSFLLPTEGFGFSDYYHSAWSKPKFESFKFTLNSNKEVTIKIRYV